MSGKPSNKNNANQQWGGRFNEPVDDFVARFTASLSFDRRIYAQDIQGSIVHSKMLCRAKLLTQQECAKIIEGLEQIRQEIETNQFNWRIELEDVHMNIEARLIELIGESGKKLHTGRSRNDQVATDIRLYLRSQIDNLKSLLDVAQTNILNLAEQEAQTIMPGFTHLQAAQPVTFGHHLLAWNQMIERDWERFTDCRKRVNICPLGSAALAGTSYPIDRYYTASELGFSEPCANSIDGVSDRDFAVEFCSVGALLMTHLSRMAEELVMWSSIQFNFIELPDRFCTGSSIMPQKKNPDVPELLRGKTGRVTGHLVNLLTLLKSQPLAYNKDNQEDKEPLFDCIDTCKDCLRAFADLVAALKPNRQRLYQAASDNYTTATDLADYLVNQGLGFRDAHHVVGRLVDYAISQNRPLDKINLDEFKQFCEHIEQDVYACLSVEGSVNARNHIGGTAPSEVKKAITLARQKLRERGKACH